MSISRIDHSAFWGAWHELGDSESIHSADLQRKRVIKWMGIRMRE